MTDQDPSVWFLTGSQHLYGPKVLEQVSQQSRQVTAMLEEHCVLPLRLRWLPVLTDEAQIRRVCQDASTDPECIGVIAWMHTFSPAKTWISGLLALSKPILQLHTQVSLELPWSSIDMDYMNINQAAHGDREMGYMMTRLRIDRTIVSGHASDAQVVNRISSWMRAASGRSEAERLRVARFGDNMRDVAVTEGDKVEAQIRLGTSVSGFGVSDLVDAVARVDPPLVDSVVEEIVDTCEVSADLMPRGPYHPALRYQASIEVALRGLMVEGNFGAFTTNFQDLGGLKQLPGLAVQRLMQQGFGFGGEGDWKTAVLVRILKVMSKGLTGGTSFMEDYTYHLGPGSPKILGAHMLEVCPSLTRARPHVEVHPLSIGNREDPVRLVFTADAGPGLVLGLVDLGDRFRLVLNEIDVVPPDQPLPKLPVAHAVWEPRPSFEIATEGWLLAGGPHHTVLSTALEAADIRTFADQCGIELVVIDSEARRNDIRDRLRWNAAYYRLAGGL